MAKSEMAASTQTTANLGGPGFEAAAGGPVGGQRLCGRGREENESIDAHFRNFHLRRVGEK